MRTFTAQNIYAKHVEATRYNHKIVTNRSTRQTDAVIGRIEAFINLTIENVMLGDADNRDPKLPTCFYLSGSDDFHFGNDTDRTKTVLEYFRTAGFTITYVEGTSIASRGFEISWDLSAN